MTDGIWISALPGAVVGIAYGITSWWMVQRALRRPPKTFLLIVMGGMLLRLLAASLVTVVVLAWLPIDAATFIGTFFGFFVISLIVEIVTLHRGLPADTEPRS